MRDIVTDQIIEQVKTMATAITLLGNNNAQISAQAALFVGEKLLLAVDEDTEAKALVKLFEKEFANVPDLFDEGVRLVEIARKQGSSKASKILGDAFINKDENFSLSCYREGMMRGNEEAAIEYESLLMS